MKHLLTIAALLLLAVPAQAALGKVIVQLYLANEADALTVKAALDSFIAGKSILACSPTEPIRPVRINRVGIQEDGIDDDRWVLRVSVCFTVRSDAEQWLSDVEGKWGSGPLQNLILSDSSVSFHMNSHGDAEVKPATHPSGELSVRRK